MAKEWRKSACPFCSLNYALEVLVEDDHIIDVRPNPDSNKEPGGYCCRKGRSVKYYQENPERLEHPLKKVGDHFEQISWEQAFREIGQKARAIYDAHGPKAFSMNGFGLAATALALVPEKGLMEALGIKYMYNPAGFEFMGLWWSLGRILGNQNIYTEPDDKNIDTVVYWGANSYVANHFVPAHRVFIKNMSEREDKKVVVVDPRLSETARMADLHIMPRNGCDVLFIRGLIAMIVDKGLEDKKYLKEFCSDWEEAKKWFTGFDYREAFRVSHVPYEKAEELVEILTTTTWGCHCELGMICGRNNTMNTFMLLTLMAVTGNFLVKGNVPIDGILRLGPGKDERDPETWRLEETGHFPVAGTYPDGAYAQEVLSNKETRHRASFICRSNPARSYPDSATVEKALDKLELCVVIDIAMTETAKHADYVLPGKTGFENHEFSFFPINYPEVVWFLRHPVIGQIGERKEDAEIILEIGRAMGVVPEVPEYLHKAAAKSCRDKDIVPLMVKVLAYLTAHPKYKPSMILILIDLLSRPEALGSASRACARIIAAVDNLPEYGEPERAGFKALPKYRPLRHIKGAKMIYDMSIMDQVFWEADSNPDGCIAGYSDPDTANNARMHIYYPDKKIQLFNDVVDDAMKEFTPEQEEKALALSEEYDMVISSGNHQDSGVDNYMRNPDTYVFRKPYVLFMNPEDAADRGIKEGEEVRVVTAAGSLTAPVKLSYRANRGYAMIPHHFGYDSTRYGRYGCSANSITSYEANTDKLTGDPEVRYVPGRIEKLIPEKKGKKKYA